MDELIKKNFSKKISKKKTTPIIHKLTTRKRIMKKYVKINQNSRDTEKIKMQVGLINKYILNEQAKLKANEIEKEIQKLKKGGGINSASFWEFKKNMDKNNKEEIPRAMIGKDGEIKTEKKEIEETYVKFYENLFEEAEIESDISKGIIDLKFVNIKEQAKLGKKNNEKNEKQQY